jgi:hypothetical protein
LYFLPEKPDIEMIDKALLELPVNMEISTGNFPPNVVAIDISNSESKSTNGENQFSIEYGPLERKRGPTVRTQERFEVFQRLKLEHSEWSQAKVASEASDVLRESLTAETVRNTYRLMGVDWERGDRIR